MSLTKSDEFHTYLVGLIPKVMRFTWISSNHEECIEKNAIKGMLLVFFIIYIFKVLARDVDDITWSIWILKLYWRQKTITVTDSLVDTMVRYNLSGTYPHVYRTIRNNTSS